MPISKLQNRGIDLKPESNATRRRLPKALPKRWEPLVELDFRSCEFRGGLRDAFRYARKRLGPMSYVHVCDGIGMKHSGAGQQTRMGRVFNGAADAQHDLVLRLMDFLDVQLVYRGRTHTNPINVLAVATFEDAAGPPRVLDRVGCGGGQMLKWLSGQARPGMYNMEQWMKATNVKAAWLPLNTEVHQ